MELQKIKRLCQSQIRSYIDVESGEAHVDDNDNKFGYTPHKQRRPMFYKTPEPPTPEPFTPAGIDILDKSQKLRRPTFYKTPEPPTPESLYTDWDRYP